MTGWVAVLAACGVCLLLKVAGYVVPERLLEGERASRIAALVTVALLAALVAVQTLAAGTSVVLDARMAALAVAAVALWLRAPFIVVVVLAAVVAAGLRAVA
jgi:Branched-chain amino acid transport protein (AzlD)